MNPSLWTRAALACALALQSGTTPAWARRLGSLLPALVAIVLCLLLWYAGLKRVPARYNRLSWKGR